MLSCFIFLKKRTDGGDCNIPIAFFFKKCGDNNYQELATLNNQFYAISFDRKNAILYLPNYTIKLAFEDGHFDYQNIAFAMKMFLAIENVVLSNPKTKKTFLCMYIY